MQNLRARRPRAVVGIALTDTSEYADVDPGRGFLSRRSRHLRGISGARLSIDGASTCVDARARHGYRDSVDIEANARKHGVPDDDMLHALRHHWRAFETDDPAVTMFIGPSKTAEPLEIGVVVDEDGAAVIHAMIARPKFLKED